jgi:hypothetical protein
MKTKLYGISTKIPVTLGVFEDAFKQLGVVGLALSINDNKSYGLGIGLVRSGIDILGFAVSAVATTAVAASGGWVVVGVGLGIGIGTEIVKWGATEIIKKFD